MKRAVVYTRVSTDKEEQERSLAIQEEVYKDYCQRNGYKLEKIYEDVGSATSVRERPNFIEMLKDAGLDHEPNTKGTDSFNTSDRMPKFDYIIVKDPSRFSRNTLIGINAINQLKKMEVTVVFENIGIKSTDPIAEAYLTMLFSMAQGESVSMSSRIKFSKKYNADNHIYRPARLPYGYAWNENREIIKHPEQSKIVELIYKSYQEEGSHLLTKKLNEMGISTQRGHKWSGDKILRIIKNKIYTGTAVVNRSKKKNVTDTKRYDVPEEEHIHIPNAVPPIVSYEQWEKANKTRKKRTNTVENKGQKPPSRDDVFYGKIFCEKCGSRFVRHTGEKEKINYFCQNRRKGLGCTVRGISYSVVSEVFDTLSVGLMDDMSNHAGYNTLMKRINSEMDKLNERRKEIIVEIERLKQENDAIEQSLIDELLAKSDTDTKKRLMNRISRNEKSIKEQEQQRQKININSLMELREKVESKKLLIEGIRTNKKISKKEKLELLKSIIVGDYECSVEFTFPTYEQEIIEFNEIFPMAEIQTVPVHHFKQKVRRNHKEAREYWQGVEESRLAWDDVYWLQGGNYQEGINVGKDSKEMEKLLDSTH